MLTRIITWVAKVATLPATAANEVLNLSNVITGDPTESVAGVDVPISSIADTPRSLVTEGLALIRETTAMPKWAVTEMIAQAEEAQDVVGLITAKALIAMSHAPFPDVAKLRKVIVLVRCLAALPASLAASAVVLGGEAAWPESIAVDVVNYLASKNYAVWEVEAWRPVGDMPDVIGVSWYSEACELQSDWMSQVACCAKAAKDFIEVHATEEDVAFNFYWTSEGKACA